MTVTVNELIGPLSVLGVYPPSGGGGGGTVTRVASGAGLTGGPITTTGTLSLAPIPVGDIMANVGGFSAAPGGVSVSDLLDFVYGTTQGSLIYRDASVWNSLTPGTSGQILQTGGTGANPSWVTSSSSGFAYVNSFWVSQANGNDSNAGTSIDTPFLTVQHAVTAAGTTPTIIYVVDANTNNSETIATAGTGQEITVIAPGTSFQGNITQANLDELILEAFYVDAFVTNSSSATILTGNQMNVTSTSTGTIYADLQQYYGYHTGGASLLLSCNILGSLSLDNSITASVIATFAQNISNAGALHLNTPTPAASCITANTGTITGMVGGVSFNGLGVAASTGTAAAYTFPTVDGTTGQALVTNGSGVVSWASGSGYTPFAYPYAYWQTVNGSDSNAGNSIETPFQTYAHVLSVAGNTPVGAWGMDFNVNNSETLNISDTSSPGVQFFAPGNNFGGTYNQTNGSSFILSALGIQNLSLDSNGNYTLLDCLANASITSAGGYNSIQINAGTLQTSSFGASDTATVIANTAYDITNAGTLTAVIGGSVASGNLTNSGTLNALIGKYAGTITNTGNIYGLLNGVFYGGLGMAASTDSSAAYTFATASPTGANQVLLSSGAGPGATTSWANAALNFNYINTYWVSQANGSDSNSGLSISEPFQTVQKAITTAASVASTIYVVDGAYNGETISSTLGTPCNIVINAPSTNFAGTFLFQNTGDTYTINAYSVNNLTDQSLGSNYLNVETASAINDYSGMTISATGVINSYSYLGSNTPNVYLNAPVMYVTFTPTAGVNAYITADNIGSFNSTAGSSTSTYYIQARECYGLNQTGADVFYGSIPAFSAGTLSGGIFVGFFGQGHYNGIGNGLYMGTSPSNWNYSLTDAAPTAANQVLLSSGAGPNATTSWGSASGYTPFAYTQAFWVDLIEGNDSNLGTSIETPFLTVQNAITAASTTPTVIYVVNGQSNTEALGTLNTGQSLTIVAPQCSFSGTLTLQPSDTLTVYCYGQGSAGAWTVNGIFDINAHTAGRIQSTNSSSVTITADALGATNFSGATVSITCKTFAGLMTLTSAASVTLLAQDATSAAYSNDGTCYVNGILNGLLPGLKGNQAIGGTLGFGDGTALNYTQTNAAPTAAGQALISSGAGPGATTSWGAAYTPFAYVRALWVSQSNGSDLNPGNTIEKPLQTLADAIASCGNTPTVIYVIDAVTNYENITTLGAGQDVTIIAPGSSFSGTWVITAPDNVIIHCTDFGIGTTVTNNGYLTVNAARCYNVTATSATTTISATAINGLTISGGNAIVSCQESVGVALTSSATLFLSSTTTTTITNDGTCTVNGILGGVNPGWQGAQAIGGALTIGTALTTGAYYTLPTSDGTAGQVPATDGAGTVSWTTPAGPTGLAWSSPVGATVTAAVGNGYVLSGGSLQTVNVPSSFAVGDVIWLEGYGAGGWIAQASGGVNFIMGTVAGAANGSVASTNDYNNCYLIGLVANTTYKVFTTNGTLTLV